MATIEPLNDSELPADNVSRLAIFDAIHEHGDESQPPALSAEDLLERVMPRLRILVPRELHLAGERTYLQQKVAACAEAGLLTLTIENGQQVVSLTGTPPLVRYPDGQLRNYTAGLEVARERLDRDNARLRSAAFDVRRWLPTSADDPDSTAFQGLLASMREHGFLKQFPILKYADDVIIDGRARVRAAAILALDVEYLKYASERDRTAARRRDNPLNRVLLAIHGNLPRLDADQMRAIHEQVAAGTGRPWDQTAADLELTAQWRGTIPAEYSPQFEVSRLPFREGDQPRIQVTPDNKVMLRSLLEAAGLSNYKIDLLRDYVPFERARSAHSAGPKAVFARAEDLIPGIAAMQAERRAGKQKLDPEWEQVRDWLLSIYGEPTGQPGEDRAAAPLA